MLGKNKLTMFLFALKVKTFACLLINKSMPFCVLCKEPHILYVCRSNRIRKNNFWRESMVTQGDSNPRFLAFSLPWNVRECFMLNSTPSKSHITTEVSNNHQLIAGFFLCRHLRWNLQVFRASRRQSKQKQFYNKGIYEKGVQIITTMLIICGFVKTHAHSSFHRQLNIEQEMFQETRNDEQQKINFLYHFLFVPACVHS